VAKYAIEYMVYFVIWLFNGRHKCMDYKWAPKPYTVSGATDPIRYYWVFLLSGKIVIFYKLIFARDKNTRSYKAKYSVPGQ
jgi:hypothetical protein